MEKDPELRERLLAARKRQDRYLAEEVERGEQFEVPPPRPEVVEEVFEPASGVPVPDVDEDDRIPDVGNGLSEEEAKAAEIFGDFDDEEDEPEVKRARAGSHVSEIPVPSIAAEECWGFPEARATRTRRAISVFRPSGAGVGVLG